LNEVVTLCGLCFATALFARYDLYHAQLMN